MKEEEENTKVVCTNRKARHLYEVLESLEAGLVLVGTEVKSLRSGKANLKDSFAIFKNGELFVLNMHISPYEQGNRYNLNPTRPRKLLLHKKEMRKLFGKVAERGLTLIPLKLYFKEKVVKIELALSKGKKIYDRKRDIKERDMQREMERAFREKNR
jgi:SsrA-binding protein